MPSRLRSSVVLGLALVAGCGFDLTGSASFEPPAVYREWYAKTEACSGRTGDFDRIEWSVVPGTSFDCPSGACVGHWQPGHHIYVAEAWAQHEMVVRHEMLHDLLQRGGHPNPPFGAGCPLTWDAWTGSPPALPSTSLRSID